MNITDLVTEAYETAKSKGFHDQDDKVTFGDRIALVHSEVSEAMEAFRKHGMDGWLSDKQNGKPEGVPSELADVVIRIADMAGTYGIDLATAIRQKLDYNKTRPYLHGIQKTNPLGRL